MSKAWHQGVFTPVNTGKCMNTKPIVFRSGWEKRVMTMLDRNPSVVKWGSEVLVIPYVNALKKRMCNYVPDLYVEVKDKKGKIHKYLYEVKPAKEAFASKAKSRYDKLCFLQNCMKWKAAQNFCNTYGIKFMVLTEEQLFMV